MLMLVGAVLVLLSAALAPGGFRHLAAIRLQRQGLLPLALGLQVLVLGVYDDGPRPLVVGGHLLSYVLAAAFVWCNRRVPGLTVLALGAACNGVTISLNGGTLPASAEALRAAGRPVEADGFTNSGVLADPVLPWLGDVFAVPAWLPFANVFSVGDVLILLGLVLAVHGSRLAPAPRVAGDALLALPRPELVAEVARARAHLHRVQQRHLELSALARTEPLVLEPVVLLRPRLVADASPAPVEVAAADVLLTLPRADLLAELDRAREGLARVRRRHDELQAEVQALSAPALTVVQRRPQRDLSVA